MNVRDVCVQYVFVCFFLSKIELAHKIETLKKKKKKTVWMVKVHTHKHSGLESREPV